MSAPAEGKSVQRLSVRDFRGPTSSVFELSRTVRRPEMSDLARMIRASLALGAVLLLGACAIGPNRDDPFEQANRVAYRVHDTADRQIVRPVIRAYVDNTPKPVQTAISNFFNNIDDFYSGVAGLLQGKWDKAGDDFGRVTLNTGFGFVGLVDLASQVGIERGEEDFGQTLGYWGLPQGPYFFIPFLGPTTLRDGTGWGVRAAIGPLSYIHELPVRYTLYGLDALDIKARLLEFEDLADKAAVDRYTFIRRAYLQRREYQVYDGQPPKKKEDEE